MNEVTITVSRGAAEHLDRLLQLVDQASRDPVRIPITMDLLVAQGLTKYDFGEARSAIEQALSQP
jgi:hypothetical protein